MPQPHRLDDRVPASAASSGPRPRRRRVRESTRGPDRPKRDRRRQGPRLGLVARLPGAARDRQDHRGLPPWGQLPIPTKPPCAGWSQRDPAGEGPARV